MAEIALRWNLRPSSVRQVVRDGWLVMEGTKVPLWQIRDVEGMNMLRTWRAREAASPHPRLTPELDPVFMALPSVETVMKCHGVSRARAYNILHEMKTDLLRSGR